MPLDRSQLLQTIGEILGPAAKEETSLNGDLIFIAGDPAEVIVRLHGNKVSVAMFAVVWEQVHLPVTKPKTWATLNWKLIPAAQLTLCLQILIDSVRQVRLSKYRKCQFCGEMTPPEWQHNQKTCMSCAENNFGVVH